MTDTDADELRALLARVTGQDAEKLQKAVDALVKAFTGPGADVRLVIRGGQVEGYKYEEAGSIPRRARGPAGGAW